MYETADEIASKEASTEQKQELSDYTTIFIPWVKTKRNIN